MKLNVKTEKEFLIPPGQTVELDTGKLEGQNVIRSEKMIRDLKGIFADEAVRSKMNPETLVYKVQVHAPVPNNTEGGLLFGTTYLMPGKVGNEYFLTHGHFHSIGNRAEYYWGIKGKGVLILMSRNRECRVEKMTPGSLHYIPGETAHRVVNDGDEELVFGACWPADAGHDYDEIKKNGFSVRLVEINNKRELIPV